MNIDFEDKFRNCIKKIGEIGEAYAEAKGQSWQMQELKGSMLASIINRSGESVVSKAEIIAKSSEYKTEIVKTLGVLIIILIGLYVLLWVYKKGKKIFKEGGRGQRAKR